MEECFKEPLNMSIPEINWERLNIEPFQTGRLNREYTEIKKYNEWDDISNSYMNGDCPLLGTHQTQNNRTVNKVIWASSYTAINSNGENVHILEYTRAMARKVDFKMFQKDPIRAITNCGLHMRNLIDLLVRRFPLEKNFEQYWFELKNNEDHIVSQDQYDLSFYYPPEWNVSVAENVPVLQFYVETKDDTYYSHLTNIMHAATYFERNSTSYVVKKQFFVEALRMVHRLLQFELFAELVTPSLFLARINENLCEFSNMPSISCTYSIFQFFLLVLKYAFGEEYYKGICLKKSPSYMHEINLPNSGFFSVIEGLMLRVFGKGQRKANWKDFKENLPEEMFFLLSRITEKPNVLRGNCLKRLVKELECPYGENKIECFMKEKLLGSGSFGDVWLAKHKGSGQFYAVKVIKNYLQSPKTTKNLFTTLVLVSQMQNKNVVRQFDTWTANSHHNWVCNDSKETQRYNTTTAVLFEYKIEKSTEYDSECETSQIEHPVEETPSYSAAQAQRLAQISLNEEYNLVVVGSSLYATAQEEHSEIPDTKVVDLGGKLRDDHNYTFIVMQAAQQSLGSKMGLKKRSESMKPLKESECIKYMKQFIDGLEYLNNIGFMHRDLKPDNALISLPKRSFQDTDGNLLISDLDTLKRMSTVNEATELLQQTLVRTPLYVSPEMASKIYNEKTDYYSIGISFAQMLYPQYCIADATQMEQFMQIIHNDKLPEILHPQFAFLLRWLTEKDPTDRIGFLSFPLLKSLLQKHKYKNWYCKYYDCYSVIIEHKETKRVMTCIRVANRKNTIREVVRRYSRRPEDYAKVLTKDQKRLAKLHEQLEVQERLANIYLRMENMADFESNTNNYNGIAEKKMLDLHDNSLVVKECDDYIYICCGFDEFETGLGKFLKPEKWLDFVFESYYKTFVRWGAYSYSNIHRSHSKPDYFVIEPNLFDHLTAEVANTGVALLWPPEKLNSICKMSESGSMFSFGLFLLWNLLASEGWLEPEIRLVVRSLQVGKTLIELEILEPYLKQLILWLCSFEPENRPSMDNIPEKIVLQRYDKPPEVDQLYSYRVSFDPMDCCSVTENGICTKRLRKHYLQKEYGILHMARNSEHKYIYTISNRNDLLEKVLKRLQICGNFKLLPLSLVTGAQQLPRLEFMLDLDDITNIIVVPRSLDAVDWFMQEEGECLSEIHYFGSKSNGLLYVHNTFVEALKYLKEYHKRGIYHGNINYDTFLLSRSGGFCLSNPVIVDENSEHFDRKAYISDCSSQEQILSGMGSPQFDIFSLGVTLCAFIYYLNDEQKLDMKVFQKDEKLIFTEKFPTEYADLVRKMTCVDPSKRIGCEEIIQILENNCSHHLIELKERERKLLIDKSKKTERQLPVAR